MRGAIPSNLKLSASTRGVCMQGKIIRGVAGFYYVNVEGEGVFECKAKGIFRYRKVKPLPGDNVGLTVISREAMPAKI